MYGKHLHDRTADAMLTSLRRRRKQASSVHWRPSSPDLSCTLNVECRHVPHATSHAGELKGDGKITYDDAYAAGSAVEIFDGKEFEGVHLRYGSTISMLEHLTACNACASSACSDAREALESRTAAMPCQLQLCCTHCNTPYEIVSSALRAHCCAAARPHDVCRSYAAREPCAEEELRWLLHRAEVGQKRSLGRAAPI